MSSLRPGTVDYSKWDNFSSDGSTNSDDKDGDRKIHKEEADENDGEDSGDEGDEESGDEDISQSPVRGNDNFHRPVASTPNATRASSSANPITPQVRAPAPSLAALQSAWHTKSTGEDHGENATIVVQGRQEKKQKVEPKLALSNLCAACGAPNPKYRCSRCERATDEDFEDDEKCLDYFHRFQTIKKLQEVREEIGYEDFQAVFEHFDSIKNSGYTLEEVIATDTGTLIDREEYLQHHVEEEHDDENSGGDRGDGNDDGETDSWEGVPEEMTRSVLTEEEQMRHAIDASRMSAKEDEVVRRVMKESSGIGD